MAFGIYKAPERVVRDGKLVCFAGEVMTMDEAYRRGLIDEKGETVEQPEPAPEGAAEPAAEPAPEDAAEPAPDRMGELMAMSRDELVELAAEIGAEHVKDANKTVIATAIVAAEAGAE